MRKLLTISIFLSAIFSFAQVDNARKTVEKLCSPEFHGRGYVNGGDSLAAEYIAQQFKDIGCKFYKKNPFQTFTFPVNTFPGTVSLTVDGQSCKPGVDFVVSPDCGSYNGGVVACIELTPSCFLHKDSLQQVLAQNKRDQLIAITYAFRTYSYKGDTLKTARSLMQELRGITAIVEIVDDKFTWSVEQTQVRNPLIQVQRSVVEDKKRFKFSARIDAKLVNHTARNVIAYIPAKKKTKKTFVFSAHYDHLGQMGDSAYFPGGNDNASGSAMLIEMARYFKEHRGNVNIAFMAFAGEEVGLLGSQYYTEHPIFPMKNIRFLFNLDIMGSGEDGVTIVNATEFPKEFKTLQDINNLQGFVTTVKSRGKAANSDHYFFTEAGVPAFFMYTMGPNKHYHDVGDTYENLSFDKFNSIYQLLIDFEEVVTGKSY